MTTVTGSVLVAPTSTLPNGSWLGATTIIGCTPLPVNDTVWEVAVIAFTFNVAVWLPTAVGAKVTLIVHEAPGRTPTPPTGQVVAVTVYRALPAIVGAASTRLAAELAAFVTVALSNLVVPTSTSPNGSGLGATVMVAATPVPLASTV